MSGTVACPFCDFSPSQGEDELFLHIETHHPEDKVDHQTIISSSFKTSDKPQDAVGTPRSGSTSQSAEPLVKPDGSKSSRRHGASHKPSKASHRIPTSSGTANQPGIIETWRNIFKGHSSEKRSGPRTRYKVKHLSAESGRPSGDVTEEGSSSSQAPSTKLGKAELGRHVNEKQMPPSLVSLLEKTPHNSEGIIPVLQQLLEQSPSTEKAYLCSPHTLHVSKLRKEGSFCGYRNIQMLISYLTRSGAPGSEHFKKPFPSIFAIQDLIEHAWDAGINAQGRIETGGVKGTRKWIGTPEAQTVALSLGISCSVQAFKDGDGKRARDKLMDAIEAYFTSAAVVTNKDVNTSSKVCTTTLPPVYFQHPGHSLTIVGFEKTSEGASNLIVFDPAYRDPPVIKAFVGGTVRSVDTKMSKALQEYRRGYRHLRRYREFELLYLVSGIQG